MNGNSVSIYDTRFWKVYGEGPSTEKQAKLTGQGFNEGKTKFTSADIRFTTKGDVLYAALMDWPNDCKVTIKSLAQNSLNQPKVVNTEKSVS
ncbi:hypothetical protein [Spirosoma pollinicola]|uniref:Uncharacterized protein n=1 Tax=Spirosoma pollinicola TaxID=2057025 RepID=A0A2K8Z9W5_9BACT|nr:hypothetical protein [Spirosoma pollinicola]AUD06673.1 hypothetical protein CWM47_35400 [Spirosoma pollinicola]